MFDLGRKFKRLIIFIVLGICVISCRKYTSNPNDILDSKDIKIEITHSGCFGGSKQIITIKEIDGNQVMTNRYIQGVYEPVRKLKFDNQKRQILLDLIRKGCLLSDSAYCTGLSIYKFETERYKCEFKDNTCQLDKYLTELMK